MMGIDRLPERLRSKISTDPSSGCWLWEGATHLSGYGIVRIDRKIYAAHRVVYEYLVAPVTSRELRCLCDMPNCVNPEHREPAKYRTNITPDLDAIAAAAVVPTAITAVTNAARSFCSHGHSLADAYVRKGTMYPDCNTCRRIRQRKMTCEAVAP